MILMKNTDWSRNDHTSFLHLGSSIRELEGSMPEIYDAELELPRFKG